MKIKIFSIMACSFLIIIFAIAIGNGKPLLHENSVADNAYVQTANRGSFTPSVAFKALSAGTAINDIPFASTLPDPGILSLLFFALLALSGIKKKNW